MEKTTTSYTTPSATSHQPKYLVQVGGPDGGVSYMFYDQIEIGRDKGVRSRTGILLIDDPTVSSRHCVITQSRDGRCFIQDSSRNGTRLDGRRLSPNLKTEITIGQVVSLGRYLSFRLEGEAPTQAAQVSEKSTETMGVPNTSIVTVLVGDIRGYTNLVQQVSPSLLQESVTRVFNRLEKAVVELGGTVKEFQGDAIFAYWERGPSPNHAAEACNAALVLHRKVREMAADPAVWPMKEYPLEMDWALCTGTVVISGYGGENALGISMVGESVVLAFRMEKLAEDDASSIIVCPDTQMLAGGSFEFKDLGTKKAKGFDEPKKLFALTGEKHRRSET
jgi:class 3 adenylate cyclase